MGAEDAEYGGPLDGVGCPKFYHDSIVIVVPVIVAIQPTDGRCAAAHLKSSTRHNTRMQMGAAYYSVSLT